jgi:hypothetical protein
MAFEVIDDLSAASIENMTQLKDQHGFSYISDSVDNHPLLLKLIDCPDMAFHLQRPLECNLSSSSCNAPH